MPRLALSPQEGARVLAGQNRVRVAFHDGRAPYVIPLGYVYFQSALYGVTETGRKTQMAEQDATVAFQVDTSHDTGLWEWSSVTGEGTFEIVDPGEEKERALDALQPVIEQAPDWWRREQGPRMASGALLVWKITPTVMTVCEYVRPEDKA